MPFREGRDFYGRNHHSEGAENSGGESVKTGTMAEVHDRKGGEQ